MSVIEIDDNHPAECDNCGNSLIGEGYCGYTDKAGDDKYICLLCAQVMALKYEYPFDK